MKQIFVIAAFLAALFPIQAWSQPVFKGQPIQSRNNQFAERFSRADLFQLDLPQIADYLHATSDEPLKSFRLQLGDRFDRLIEITPDNDQMHTDHINVVGPDGRYELPIEGVMTYTGRCVGAKNAQVQVTATGQFLRIKVTEKDQTWFVESTCMNSGGAAANQVMVYNNKDVRDLNKGEGCGWSGFDQKAKVKKKEHNAANRSGQIPCVEYQLDLVADGALLWLFAEDHAPTNYDIQNLAAAMISITLGAEEIWSPFGVNFIVSGITIFTCQNNNCLPWDDASEFNDGSDLLSDFSDWADDYLGEHDVAQLWTGRDYQVDGKYSTVGLSYVDGVCDELLERNANWCEWDVNPNRRDNLSAHENGHSFDADHDVENAALVMSPKLNDGIVWSDEAKDDIIETIEDFDCLTPCGTVCPYYLPLNGTYFAPYTHIEADHHISSTGTVIGFGGITFDAGSYIEFKPGFSASAGFSAIIDGCGENLKPGASEDRISKAEIKQVKPETAVAVAPNPFSGSTTITYTLQSEQQVSIQLMDAMGRLVATPLAPELQPEGEHQFNLDAGNLSAGMYFLVTQLGEKRNTTRLILTR
jgi:hypothetical protein